MEPSMPGVRLTLVSAQPFTPYSGMLPGLIAGHYTFDEMHINLERLCQRAGVRFIADTVTGIDSAANQVQLAQAMPLSFDVLSIDTGSTPSDDIPGVAEFAIPVKPISHFWRRWQKLLPELRERNARASIAMVGGGAGSVELILAMAHACLSDPGQYSSPHFQLVCQSATILPGYPDKVRRAAEHACARFGIHLYTSCQIIRVSREGMQSSAGECLAADYMFWCTQAAAPLWPQQAGLACDTSGFITVNASLQSTSHPKIFAAGDIAHMKETPIPKAGVYAVRQAPVLHDNLKQFLGNKALKSYRPQRKFLSLLSLGSKQATGCRGPVSFSGKWVWFWKNIIDKHFMNKLSH